MAFGRHTSGFNTEVGRYGRAITMFGSGLLALALGSVATATPVLTFDSVTAVANGTTATPVTITVKVTNTGTALATQGVTSRFTWTASGTGATAGDLTVVDDSGSVNTAGYLYATNQPLLDSTTLGTGTAGWAISALSNATMAPGETTVATLNLLVAAGVTSGTFNVNFVTGGFNTFTVGDFNSPSDLPYTNGNNGTTTGVITVVPEPVATGYVATAGVVAAGLGFVQRRSRRSRRLAEVAG